MIDRTDLNKISGDVKKNYDTLEDLMLNDLAHDYLLKRCSNDTLIDEFAVTHNALRGIFDKFNKVANELDDCLTKLENLNEYVNKNCNPDFNEEDDDE